MDHPLLAHKQAQDGHQSRIWTAMPAVVTAVNLGKVTVDAQITIQAQVRQPDGTIQDTTITVCKDCPVLFPGGGGFLVTFPIAAGDEGLLVFGSRCIDAWWQNGGVQKQAELRMHDLSDGFFIPTGGMSNPNVAVAISTTAAEFRTKDSKTVIHLEPTKISLSVNNGDTSLVVDDSAQRVTVVATNGLWVNGVRVTVP